MLFPHHDRTGGDCRNPDRRRRKVYVSIASANRDPRRWEEPERFNISRKIAGHVGFGAGIHACVGQMIARLEIEALTNAMVERVATIELARRTGAAHAQHVARGQQASGANDAGELKSYRAVSSPR